MLGISYVSLPFMYLEIIIMTVPTLTWYIQVKDDKRKIMKKTILIVITILVLIPSAIWGYITFRKHSAEEAVHEYLLKKGTEESNIVSLEPFIANLSGSENYMVAVRLKDDGNVYYYYKDGGEVKLESSTISQLN